MHLTRTSGPTRRAWRTAAAGVALASLVFSPVPASARSNAVATPTPLATPGSGPLATRALELSAPSESPWARPPASEPPACSITRRATAQDHRASFSQWSPTAPRGVRPRGVSRKVIFGLLGAAGGFLIGGAIGARIEGNSCACDDPGMKGWIIGAPVGAIFGGYAGVKLAGR